MRLTREICEAVLAGYLLGSTEKPRLDANGFVKRSAHQRRRGKPPKTGYKAILAPRISSKEIDLNKRRWGTIKKKRKYTKRSDYWKGLKVED